MNFAGQENTHSLSVTRHIRVFTQHAARNRHFCGADRKTPVVSEKGFTESVVDAACAVHGQAVRYGTVRHCLRELFRELVNRYRGDQLHCAMPRALLRKDHDLVRGLFDDPLRQSARDGPRLHRHCWWFVHDHLLLRRDTRRHNVRLCDNCSCSCGAATHLLDAANTIAGRAMLIVGQRGGRLYKEKCFTMQQNTQMDCTQQARRQRENVSRLHNFETTSVELLNDATSAS